jgi:hypothetical protein
MLRAYETGASGVRLVASAGLDGRIAIWDVTGSDLETRVGGINIRH